MKNFRNVEKTSAECNEDSYLVILHISRVELHCKLQEKLHRVTWPLGTVHYLWLGGGGGGEIIGGRVFVFWGSPEFEE